MTDITETLFARIQSELGDGADAWLAGATVDKASLDEGEHSLGSGLCWFVLVPPCTLLCHLGGTHASIFSKGVTRFLRCFFFFA